MNLRGLARDRRLLTAFWSTTVVQVAAVAFDVKILKEIIKLRKQDQEERDERDSLLDTYMRAMDAAEPEPVGKAA